MDQIRAGRLFNFFSKQEGSSFSLFPPAFTWMAAETGKDTHTIFKIRNNSPKRQQD